MDIADDGADLPQYEPEYDKYDDEPYDDSPEPPDFNQWPPPWPSIIVTESLFIVDPEEPF